MKPFTIVSIVEGHGEVSALPSLLHRFHAEANRSRRLDVNPPLRVKAGQFLKFGDEFKRTIALAAAKARQSQPSLLLTLLDCEDHCPARIGPEITRRQKDLAKDIEHLVVLAHREFETWFLASAGSLAGVKGLSPNLVPPANAEAIRGAKEWLGARMSPRGYDEIVHQRELSKCFDLEAASAVPSFRRFRSRIKNSITNDTPCT